MNEYGIIAAYEKDLWYLPVKASLAEYGLALAIIIAGSYFLVKFKVI